MKFIGRFLAVLIALAVPAFTQPAHAQFTYTFYPDDATINSDVTTDLGIVGYASGEYDASFNRNFVSPSSPTIHVVDGANITGEIDTFNSSIVNISGGTEAFLVAYDNSTINVSGGSFAFMLNEDNAVINMNGGYVSDLEGQGQAIHVGGGTVDYLVANVQTSAFGDVLGSCVVDTTGGAFFRAEAQNLGVLNVRGGTFAERIVAAFGGTVNIYGTGLTAILIDPNFTGGGSSYSRYSLSGTLADGSTLTNHDMIIRNDHPGDGSFQQSSFNLISTAAAPEPGTLALVLCGGFGGCGLFLWRRGC